MDLHIFMFVPVCICLVTGCCWHNVVTESAQPMGQHVNVTVQDRPLQQVLLKIECVRTKLT